MTPAPKPGDIILTGINGQAFVSLAIKLGSVLRFQPLAARVAGIGQLLTLAATIVAIVTLDWPWYTSILLALVGFVVSCAVVWAVATIMRDRKAPWGRYSHAALIVDQWGETKIAEALAHGVSISPIDKYPVNNYTHIETAISDEDLSEMHIFVAAVLAAKTKYGFVTFFGLFIYCITASIPILPTIMIQQSGTSICSGFVCDAGTRWGEIWEHEPYWMMPAHIAAHYGVE